MIKLIKGIYVTTASLNETTGGGKVGVHELSAMRGFCDVVDVIQRDDFTDDFIMGIIENPFIYDYATSNLIGDSYDLAHFNGSPFGVTVQTLRYFNPNIKIVSTVPAHNLEESIKEHKLYGVDYAEMYPHMIHRFEEYTQHNRESDLVIYPSAKSRDYLVKRLNLTNDSTVIHHGTYIPEHPPPIPEEFAPAYIGILGPDKGIKYLIEAWSELDLPETLMFYGSGSSILDALVSAFAEAGKFDRVGYYEALGDIMGEIGFGIFPSVTEGFNLCVLELMAYARPCIVGEGAGISEIIEDGVDGFVVPIRDVEAIKDKIIFCRDNPSVVVEMGMRARDKAIEHQWNDVERNYQMEYVRLLKEKEDEV